MRQAQIDSQGGKVGNICRVLRENLYAEIEKENVVVSVYNLSDRRMMDVTAIPGVETYQRFPTLRPIQQYATSLILNTSENFIGISPTGTGKTIAFLLGTFLKLVENAPKVIGKTKKQYLVKPRLVIIAPTRTLRNQIYGECLKLREDLGLFSTNFGIFQLRDDAVATSREEITGGTRCDVLVTMASTLRGVLKQEKDRWINLSELQFLVVDEADSFFGSEYHVDFSTGEILQEYDEPESAFAYLVRIAGSARVLFFSATFSAADLQYLAKVYVDRDFKVLEIQNSLKRFVQVIAGSDSLQKTCRDIIRGLPVCRIVIFVGGNKIAEMLQSHLKFMKSQVLRTDSKQVEETLDDFVKGKFNILITVPIVFGRGVHVDRIQLVINYGVSSLVPRQTVMAKDKYYARYKHQIGRTGRGLETGVALTLLESDQDLLEEVKDACLEILSQEGQAANIENLSENQDLALGKDLYFDFATLFTPEDGKTLTRRIADTQKIFDLRKTIRVFQARISRLEEVTQALDTQYKENESTQIFAEYVLRKGELDDFRDKLDTAKHSLQILTNRF